MHELDSDTNLEIVDELTKAQARVRFLKKKLRQRGVSDLLKQTSRKQHLLSKSPREKLMVRRMLRRKNDISEQEDLQERDESESGECVQGSIDSEMATHGENQESKTSMKIGLEREEEEEDSTDKIFKMKNSETSQGSMDLLNHLSSQYNVIAPRSNMWACKQCILQGRCSNECTSMEGFGSESSTHLPDLEGHLFGQKSQTDDPFSSKRHILIDVSAPIYSQSTATALAKPGNELRYLQSGTEYFKCSFEQDFSEQGLMDSDLAAESVLHELDLLLHRNTAADAVECSDLVSKPIDVHEHLGCQHFSLQTSGEHSAETQVCQSSFIQHNYHEADLLGSSYPESKQIMEHQNSAEKSSKLCVSDLLLHHPPSASVMHSRYVAAGFEHECARAEPYSVQTSVGGFCGGGCTSREETWKQEPFDEQRLMEADNLWAEDQFIFQDETFSLDRFDFTC